MTVYCHKCAAPGLTLDVEHDGKVVATGVLCEPCLEQAFARYHQVKAEFQALIAAGVSKAEANRIMIAKLDGTAVVA